MEISRGKLYALLSVALLAGYIWLFYELATNPLGDDHSPGVCLFKSVTNLPCPSCGSTRAILALFRGDFIGSVSINPLGTIVALIMVITPLWLIYDITTRRKTLLEGYRRMENIIRRPYVAIPLIVLVLINWIWNISKGL
jgi:hypothetical protein